MCFGWYQELLRETRVPDLGTAEVELLRMLDEGGMIVHAYRDQNQENPELVGRHSRLRRFIAAEERPAARSGNAPPHEVERFLLDAESLAAWSRASETADLIDYRWSVVEFWSAGENSSAFYGKAVLCRTAPIRSSPSLGRLDMVRTPL